MSRSLAYFITLLSIILFVVVVGMKYFGLNVPIVSDIVSGKLFETTLLAYVLLLIPAILR